MDQQRRHKRLLRLLVQHDTATVPQLVDWLGVSPATIRRDIRLLDTARQIRRVHGAVRRMDAGDTEPLRASTFDDSARAHGGRKRAIARRAAALCADGDTLLVGGGTTTFNMVDFLAPRGLRVVTNSFEVARHLLANTDNDVILSGGKIYPEQGIILSPFETEAQQYCHADKLFIGARCLSALGLMEADPLLIQAGRRLISQAQQVIVLADSSKFENLGGMFLCALDKISCVITDTGASDANVRMLERAGVRVILVAPDAGLADGGAAPHALAPPAGKPPH